MGKEKEVKKETGKKEVVKKEEPKKSPSKKASAPSTPTKEDKKDLKDTPKAKDTKEVPTPTPINTSSPTAEDKNASKKNSTSSAEPAKAVTEPVSAEATDDSPPATQSTPAEESEKPKTDVKPAEDKASESTAEPLTTNGRDTEAGIEAEVTNRFSVVDLLHDSAEDGKVRLFYFDGSGRAELARLVMAQAGMGFEDIRVTAQEWKELKPETPFGQLPILTFEGQMFCQSITIARFLAKRAGLYGETVLEQTFSDMIVDCATDFNNKWVAVFRAQSWEEQVNLVRNNIEVFLPKFFRSTEEILQSRGGKYFAGDKLTFGDIYMFHILYSFTDPEDPFYKTLPHADERLYMLEDYQLLVGLVNRVMAEPGIKEWIRTRPEGLF